MMCMSREISVSVIHRSTRGKPMKYYLVFVQENGNVREVQENIEVDYKTYIETFEKVRK